MRRPLPTMGRRTVGAWCFVDQYGPDDIAGTSPPLTRGPDTAPPRARR